MQNGERDEDSPHWLAVHGRLIEAPERGQKGRAPPCFLGEDRLGPHGQNEQDALLGVCARDTRPHVGLPSHLLGRKRCSRSWGQPQPTTSRTCTASSRPAQAPSIETFRDSTSCTLRPRPLATGAVSTPGAAGDAEASAHSRRK